MLKGNRIKLVAPRKAFIPTFTQWLNDQDLLQYLIMYKPMTLEAEEKWYESMINRDDEIFFSIMKIADKDHPDAKAQLIGNLSIRIDAKNRVGNIGIMIGEKSVWGQGYGTEALKLLIEYAFNNLNLQRVELEVFSSNPRAQHCYEKVGFRKEGVRRNAVFIQGRYVDSIMMGLLLEEWKINTTKERRS